jgi:hypothetical protein
MLANGYPIFNLILGVNVRKSPENLFVNTPSELNPFFLFKPEFLTFSTFLKILNLAHNCSDCKKLTLKTKGVKDEIQD